MRKATYVLLAMLLAVALPSDGAAQGIGLGVKGGVNLANMTGDDAGDTDMNTGFAIGGFLNFDLGTFSIQPEALFSQKGASMSFEGIESDWNVSYLEVPVLFRIGLGVPGAPMNPVLFAGPSVGYLLSSKGKGSVEGASVEFDMKDDTKSFDVGAVIGAGIDFGNIQLDARYNLGFTNVGDGDDAGDVKNSTISIMLGYRL